ncbi:unnamed protein product [Trifolium pratense]|uniref:Uncharacterized protein n=1 Tax=Trifolium pratense TaxID=57577 RepID=A0ACB0IKZ3_TRIPR|nr:unnamed protein product [Trifolium pratense]
MDMTLIFFIIVHTKVLRIYVYKIVKDKCSAFQYKYEEDQGIFKCYTKLQWLNGRHSPSLLGTIYLRLPKGNNFFKEESTSVQDHVYRVLLHKVYANKPTSNLVKFFLWLSIAVGGLEFVFFFVVYVFFK